AAASGSRSTCWTPGWAFLNESIIALLVDSLSAEYTLGLPPIDDELVAAPPPAAGAHAAATRPRLARMAIKRTGKRMESSDPPLWRLSVTRGSSPPQPQRDER